MGREVSDYRRASPALAPLTLRWGNLSGLGWFSGCLTAVAMLCFAGLFAAIATLIIADTIKEARQRVTFTISHVLIGFVLLAVIVAIAAFFAIGALGTSGIVIERARGTIVRWHGLVFIPLFRKRYPLEPALNVYVDWEQRRRRSGSHEVYFVRLAADAYSISLREFESREPAEEQAKLIRDYLEL